jgi:hypothetical protein
MAIDRDYSSERLARIDALLADAKHAQAKMARADAGLTRDLTAKLDVMLQELRWPEGGAARISGPRI